MILIFGKTGQVAAELQRISDVLAMDRDLVNLSNPSSCYDAIKTHKPKAVINAAAYTNVDKAEAEEELATIINGNSPKAMAQACATLNIPLVHLSTDYVFDGTGIKPWHPVTYTVRFIQCRCTVVGRSRFAVIFGHVVGISKLIVNSSPQPSLGGSQ